MRMFRIIVKELYKKPPDKDSIYYVVVPRKQGREPKVNWSFSCFFELLKNQEINNIEYEDRVNCFVNLILAVECRTMGRS